MPPDWKTGTVREWLSSAAGNGYSTNLYRCRAVASSSRSRMPAAISRGFRRPSTRHRNGRRRCKHLSLVATSGGPTMFARIGVMRALNRHVERVFDPRSQGSSLGTAEAEAGSIDPLGLADSALQVGAPALAPG
jgi:hypothetical protein